jgi:aminobenzoyl-glutamate utilization protein B
MKNTQAIWDLVDQHRASFVALADTVWATPETCYMETRSAAAHEAALREHGFSVRTGLADIPTSVVGEAGSGGPVIAFLGEFDALPGLSQEAGNATHTPLQAGGNGHGCGHNLLGAGSLLAARALKDYLQANNLPGRVRYYGCPAEEGGGAKAFMVRAGLFDDVDIAITWHPGIFAEVTRRSSLANTRIDFTFTGRAAHASSAPHLGRSALDAVELTNVGCNYLREHVPTDTRMHYAILDAGGIAPNVVQARAKVRYSVRSSTVDSMLDVLARVQDVARGAALMTGTSVEIKIISSVANLINNAPLQGAMSAALAELGPPQFSAEDESFARAIQATLSPEHIRHDYERYAMPPRDDKALADFLIPADIAVPTAGVASTDLADVSWVVPTVQLDGANFAIGTPFHSWQLVAQGKSAAAHTGMIHAAKVMAATAVKTLEDASLREAAANTLNQVAGRARYKTAIPEGALPPIADMTAS